MKLLLVSKYILDYQPMHTSLTDVEWVDCSLRQWLNETFLYDAFSDEERNMMLAMNYPADNVSVPEDYMIFTDEYYREPTNYAKAEASGVGNISDNELYIIWRLSDAYDDSGHVYAFDYSTHYFTEEPQMVNEYHGVCPVVWISINF